VLEREQRRLGEVEDDWLLGELRERKNNWEVIRNTMEIWDNGIELKKLILQ
jgi:phosphodiesterase/alkaline phosphatase D-like protein